MGKWALVGAPGDGYHTGLDNAGSVYMIDVDLARTHRVLNAPDARAGAHFGGTVAMMPLTGRSGTSYLIIGAPNDPADPSAGDPYGSVYVWRHVEARGGSEREEIALHAKLIPAPLEAAPRDGHFGAALGVSTGGRLVVGAPGPHSYPAGAETSADNGFAYVFDLASGEQLAKLSPSAGGIAGTPSQPLLRCFWFGAAVAITDQLISIGAPRARAPCSHHALSGAVFLFDGIAFQQRAKWLPPDGEPLEFGTALRVLHGTTADQVTDVENDREPSGAEWGPLEEQGGGGAGHPVAVAIGAPGAGDGRGALFLSHPLRMTGDGAITLPPGSGATAWLAQRVDADGAGSTRLGIALAPPPSMITTPDGVGTPTAAPLLAGALGYAIRLHVHVLGNITSVTESSPLRRILAPDQIIDPGDSSARFGEALARSEGGVDVVGASRTGTPVDADATATAAVHAEHISGAVYLFYPPYPPPSPGAPPARPPTPPDAPPLTNPFALPGVAWAGIGVGGLCIAVVCAVVGRLLQQRVRLGKAAAARVGPHHKQRWRVSARGEWRREQSSRRAVSSIRAAAAAEVAVARAAGASEHTLVRLEQFHSHMDGDGDGSRDEQEARHRRAPGTTGGGATSLDERAVEVIQLEHTVHLPQAPPLAPPLALPHRSPSYVCRTPTAWPSDTMAGGSSPTRSHNGRSLGSSTQRWPQAQLCATACSSVMASSTVMASSSQFQQLQAQSRLQADIEQIRSRLRRLGAPSSNAPPP